MLMRSPVFLGLARPPRYLGLPVGHLVVLTTAVGVTFALTKSLWVLLLGAVAYGPLWVMAEREPRLFELVRASHALVRGTDHAA